MTPSYLSCPTVTAPLPHQVSILVTCRAVLHRGFHPLCPVQIRLAVPVRLLRIRQARCPAMPLLVVQASAYPWRMFVRIRTFAVRIHLLWQPSNVNLMTTSAMAADKKIVVFLMEIHVFWMQHCKVMDVAIALATMKLLRESSSVA